MTRRRRRTENLQAVCLLQLLFSLSPAAERPPTGITQGMHCLNNYGSPSGSQGLRRVDCTWHWNRTMGEGPFYLSFSDTFGQSSELICRLSRSSETREELRCSAEGPGEFQENDEYKVSLHDASLGGKVASPAWEETYEPMRNIKCDPPYDFRSNMSGSKCLIEWKKPEAYVTIWEAMQWQLQFRAAHVPWEQAENKTVVTRETCMEIDGSEFTPGTSYMARVRCKTPDNEDAYISQWSEWSTTAEWSVPQGPLLWQESPVAFVSVPLGLGTLLFLLLLAGSYSRIKSRCFTSTPSPAGFFLPLYTSHRGNFQAWIGIKEQDVWLRGGDSTDPGKGAGPGLTTPRPPEAISQLSSLKCLSEVELPSEERVGRLLGAPGQQDEASNYAVMRGEVQALILHGRAPLPLGGLDTAREGFPYLPYKNSLFVAQEAEILSSPSQGTNPCSVVPM